MAAELWSRTEDRRLLGLWDDGLAISEITAIIGRSKGAVNARLRRLGIRRGKSMSRRPVAADHNAARIQWTPDMDRQLLELRASGASKDKIAAIMGHGTRAIRERLQALDPHLAVNPRRPDNSLCWYCAHSVGADQCSWAARFKPVPGWDALRRDKDSGESYFVRDCPQYEEG